MVRVPKPAPVAFSSGQLPATRRAAPSKAVVRAAPVDVEAVLRASKPLTKNEARALTDEIRHRTVQLWNLVARAHDGSAYTILGYVSWKDYAEQELNMSESRSFQLLDQAKVMRALTAAGADVDTVAPPPARIVQRIKHDLPAVREYARLALERGEDLSSAIRAFAKSLEEAQRTPPPPRKSDARTVNCPACEGTGHMFAGEARSLKKVLSGL